MKSLSLLIATSLALFPAFSETLVMQSGNTIEGTIIHTNDNEYAVLTDFAIYNFAKSSFKEIRKLGTPSVEKQRASRLPDFRSTVLSLIGQTWCSNVMQIPATVIDKGMLRNVPYVSVRCNDDYEVNIYGDVRDPAGIEAGVCRTLRNQEEAKRNCLRFIASVLSDQADKDLVQSLDLEKDAKALGGCTFEITPPSAEDSYGGWWVSVYSEKKLSGSRASEKEMAQITVSKAAPPKNDSSWTSSEMKLARTPPTPVAAQPVLVAPQQADSYQPPSYTSSGGGTVYVKGYSRKDGTYVQPYTRSAPRR